VRAAVVVRLFRDDERGIGVRVGGDGEERLGATSSNRAGTPSSTIAAVAA
jgi:hypothetical protein